MKAITRIKSIRFISLFVVLTLLGLTACVPNIFDDGSYDMSIIEISNPRLEGSNTVVDVRVVNRGCPPQAFQNADVEKAGSNFKIGIRYKDGDGFSTCATFEEIHSVDLGQLSSGDYFVQARGQSEPSLTLTVP